MSHPVFFDAVPKISLYDPLAEFLDATPERGDILVEFGQDSTSGVTGVIANVVSMLTGATADTGFKGLAGRFNRCDRLFFSVEMPGEMRFPRLDTNQAVTTAAN